MAVTHFVWALSGAPGPTQAANAAGEDDRNDAAPTNALATEPAKYARNFEYLVIRPLPERAVPHTALRTMLQAFSINSQSGLEAF